jgi:hypothetical protein
MPIFRNQFFKKNNKMDQLNFINESNDQNNSQVVVFQQNSRLLDEIPVAWRIIPLGPGATASVPVDNNAAFFVAIANPEIEVNGGIMTIKEFSTPAIAMTAGETAYVTGDADSGYLITVKN